MMKINLSNLSIKLTLLILLGICNQWLSGQSLAHNYCQASHQHTFSAKAFTNTGNNSRSDTIDVLNYSIFLDISDISSQQVNGSCEIEFIAKVDDVLNLKLDLLDLEVSEVSIEGIPVDFTYSSPSLDIQFASPISTESSTSILISYSGSPSTASFGGFYFTSAYAYNLGVGIGIDPPTFGRAWFPCIDNFVERSTYNFSITTDDTKMAICNGTLESTADTEDGKSIWNWSLSDPIPTYLASVAVSDYSLVNSSHTGIDTELPIILGARANDTTNLKDSFIHLPEAINAFEEAFGAYQWERIGFVIVPFNGGAMEHATNIAYPRFAINGSLDYETLMAHEFAHHWWGDLATCETAEDMWLNEGWASYCEKYFLEHVYGADRYKTEMRELHRSVMQFTHVSDGEYYPVSGIPAEYTYGSTVYNKGADVIHSLRAYMGDESFFDCTKAFLEERRFNSMNSPMFESFLSDCSGIDLSHYFEGFIYQPGFSHFSIDSSFVTFNNGGYDTELFVRQRLNNADNYYQQVPIEVSFFDFELNEFTTTIMANDACSAHTINVPFYPIFIALDLNEKLGDATIDNYKFIKETGDYEFPETNVSLNVNQITDSALVRVTHHWVMPDRPASDIGPILSGNRYFSIEGVSQGTFLASASFKYDGSGSTTTGYLDNELISSGELNLTVVYRPNSGSEWQVWPSSINIDPGATNLDKKGIITIENLQFGEYALAIYDSDRSDEYSTVEVDCLISSNGNLGTLSNPSNELKLYPNPGFDSIQVETKANFEVEKILVYDLSGKLLYKRFLAPDESNDKLSIDVNSWPNGIYQLLLFGATNKFSVGKFTIQHF